jgi:hypothetical protein
MAHDPGAPLAARMLRRLGAKASHSIVFILLGIGIGGMTLLPNWLPYMNEFSLRSFSTRWWHDVLALLLGATLVTLALRVFVDRAAELAQRPSRFAVLLLLVASAATVLMWLVVAHLKQKRLVDIAFAEFFYTWWQMLLWGGLVGWLYVLSLQRSEDQEQLDALRLRRAMLARELARARLGTARAQIDPAMVARILREVQRRYRTRPDAAAILLERLIAYLRLAMQRVQQAAPSVPAEASLARAYAALHEAEHNTDITHSLQTIIEPGVHADVAHSAAP